MMRGTCPVVFLLLLGLLSCSFSEELHTYSASDSIGQTDEESQLGSTRNDALETFLRKATELFSTKNLNEVTDDMLESKKEEIDLLYRELSPLSTLKRSKRQIFSPFGLLRRFFFCRIAERLLPVTTVGVNKEWTRILATDLSGNEVSGSKSALRDAVMKGARIKVKFQSFISEVQSCRLINSDVCCQGIHHIFSPTFGRFETDSTLVLKLVCTTGDINVVRHFVEGPFSSEDNLSRSFEWFIYRNTDGNYPLPLLRISSGGIIMAGSQSAVVSAVRAGKSLTVVREDSVLAPIENVQLRDGTVSAQHVWRIGMDVVGNRLKFVRDIYWRFVIFKPTGSRDIARWFYGAHILGNQTNKVVAQKWYARDDWIEAFTSTPTCNSFIFSQSRQFLRSRVEAGVPIKARFGETYVEVDNVMISGNVVSAQVIAVVSREDAGTLGSDINWEFSTISTRGSVRTHRPLVGSVVQASAGTTISSQNITWFYDRKDWNLLLHVSNNGFIVSGTVLAVRLAANRAADIRVGYRRNGDPGFRFQTVDNVFIDPITQNVAVQLIRLLRDVNVGNEFAFDDAPVWSFTFLTTQGIMRKTEWLVGAHVNQGTSEENVEVKFFSPA